MKPKLTPRQAKKLIRVFEESNPMYNKMSDFYGVNIDEVATDPDDDDTILWHYISTFHFSDKSETYYDCCVDEDTLLKVKKSLSKAKK
jgi:hypothetical protein